MHTRTTAFEDNASPHAVLPRERCTGGQTRQTVRRRLYGNINSRGHLQVAFYQVTPAEAVVKVDSGSWHVVCKREGV